jgi:subtilisin family serine protease
MWAVEQDVDIITMSFGMENNDDDIARAIREAYNRSIIIFAAASNGGGNQKLTYPARNAEVIAIYATDGKGNKSGFNPTPKSRGLNFAVPGEAIKSAWTTYPNASGKPQTKRKSGTSYATPIAAGIAALILDFAKSNEVPWYAKLRDRHGMSNVFEAMAGHRDGYDYICPWEQLFKKEDSLESILGSIRKEVVNK